MSNVKTVTIDPVTRIEGHAKITIQLDDKGIVQDAELHVTQFRGFEKFCEGRPYTEMPALMARICGICPVSHLMASSKACDSLLAVKIPETAMKLRKIMNAAQIVQSHALSFFHLSSPDFIFGMDSDPSKRNIGGLLQEKPGIARDGIRLRMIGQQIIELLGGKRIHPAWSVPGGVSSPLTKEHKENILKMLPEGFQIIEKTLEWYKRLLTGLDKEIATFGNFPSMFAGLVTPDGALDFYDGTWRINNSQGEIVNNIDLCNYQQFIGEAVGKYSYLKFPYYKPIGYPEGMYRVGPLARLNIATHLTTSKANGELLEFKKLENKPILSSFHQHYARLIEILHSLELMDQLLNDSEILDTHVKAQAGPNASEGIGFSEAPRGTLIHHYKIDDKGLLKWANLIVATGHNNLAMNKSITQVAKQYISGKNITEGALNRVEAVIRSYDPCLSCSTHAIGKMPLQIFLIDSNGNIIEEIKRW